MSGLFEVIAAEDPKFVDSAENYAKQAKASADSADASASQASASASQANSAALVSQQIKADVENIRNQVSNSETNVNNIYNDVASIQQDVTTKYQQVTTDASQVSSDKVIVTQLKADTQTIYNNTVTEKNAAVAARTGAETARDTSVAKATEANNSAFLSRDWAIKTTGPVDGSDYSAKYWALQAATSVTGVSSFKGRQGAVVPASGDYTAAMVGALPSTGGTVQALKIAASVGNSKVELGTSGTVRLEKVGNDAVVVTDEPAGTPILKGQVNPKVNVNNTIGTLYSTINKPTANDVGALPNTTVEAGSGALMRVGGVRDTDIQNFLLTKYSPSNKPTSNDITGLSAVIDAISPPLGSVEWENANRQNIRAGYLPSDGQILNRADYPDLWARLVTNAIPIVQDTDWLSNPTKRGCFSLGNNSTTFRLPDLNGKTSGSLGAVFLRGDGLKSTGINGVIQNDAIKTHSSNISYNDGRKLSLNPGGGGLRLNFDDAGHRPDVGELLVNYIGENETRPVNVTGCFIVKMIKSSKVANITS